MFSPRSAEAAAERNAEAEIARNLWRNHRIFPPESRWRDYWDAVLLLLVIYNCLYIPLELGFRLSTPGEWGASRIVNLCFDFLFLVDVLLNFRTSYFEDEEIVTDQKKIALRYLKSWCAARAAADDAPPPAARRPRAARAGRPPRRPPSPPRRFVIDFLATIPWGEFSPAIQVLKLTRLLRLVRLLKKLDRLKGANAFRIVKLLGGFFMLAHWVACMWWAIGIDNGNLDLDANLNHTSWIVRISPVGTGPAFAAADYSSCVDACIAKATELRGASSPTNTERIHCMGAACDSNALTHERYCIGDDCDEPSDLGQQYLSSLYWALTMLMKTPYVGPDTTSEKARAPPPPPPAATPPRRAASHHHRPLPRSSSAASWSSSARSSSPCSSATSPQCT